MPRAPLGKNIRCNDFSLVSWANGDLGPDTTKGETIPHMASRRREVVGPTEHRSLTDEIERFAQQVRRLRNQAEPTLYPHYVSLIASSYERAAVHIDSNRYSQGVGFPDLTVSRNVLCLNWIEVKSPDVSIDPLPRLDQERFARYRTALPHIVLTNGWAWRVFEAGELTASLDLPRDWLLSNRSLTPSELEKLGGFLKRCALLSPTEATSEEEAVDLLAGAANLVRLTVEETDEGDYPVLLKAARASFTSLLRTNPAEKTELGAKEFADALAQITAFGFLLGRIEAGEPVTPRSAQDALSTTEHPFSEEES